MPDDPEKNEDHPDKDLERMRELSKDLREGGKEYIAVLAAIGLKPHMIWRENGPPIFDRNAFTTYTEQSYLDSPIAEMDEIHRMHSHVMMHKESGLRVKVSTTENYTGDEVDYRVDSVVVLLQDGREVLVLGLDMEKRTIQTEAGDIAFAAVDRTISKGIRRSDQ